MSQSAKLEKNCTKERRTDMKVGIFGFALTVLLKRIGWVVRYSIGVKFLERREDRGQAH